MGFRMRKSFKVAPGVRLNVSKTGIGASMGVRGARYSVHSSGRRTKSVGIPGTGMGWVSSSSSGARKSSSAGGSPSSPASSRSTKPGIFAPKGEKLLYEALVENHPELLERVAAEHPDYALVAEALAGFQLADNDRRIQLLSRVFETGKDPSLEPFFQRYIPRTSVTVEIAAGVVANLPLNRDAVALTLAELHQAAGHPSAAIDVVEQLEPTSYAAVSLAELYSQLGQHEEVIKLTEGIKNEDDSTALLLVFRGIALREQGMNDAALEAFKEVLRLRSRPPEIRHLALFERATAYRSMNKKAQARKDLERIIAADSNFPSVREALEELSS
jgi:tetratricopeptide (TPR) repeat protein